MKLFPYGILYARSVLLCIHPRFYTNK